LIWSWRESEPRIPAIRGKEGRIGWEVTMEGRRWWMQTCRPVLVRGSSGKSFEETALRAKVKGARFDGEEA
jgi:hypothetical protein